MRRLNKGEGRTLKQRKTYIKHKKREERINTLIALNNDSSDKEISEDISAFDNNKDCDSFDVMKTIHLTVIKIILWRVVRL